MFLLSCFGNTIFVGMPIVAGVFNDPQFSAEVIFYDALATTLPISLLDLLYFLWEMEKSQFAC